MITRRRMLATTAGLAALAPIQSVAAETPLLNVPPNRRNETMEIKRIGSQPSGKGPAEYFTGAVRIDPLVSGARSGACCAAPASHSSRAPAPPGIRIRSVRL